MTGGKGCRSKSSFCCLFLTIWMLLVVQALSTSSRCRVRRVPETIIVKDNSKCIPTKVRLGMCSGRCRSYAFPNTKINQDWKPFVRDCSCCLPKKLETKTITFKGCKESVKVTDIRSCKCKKCSLR